MAITFVGGKVDHTGGQTSRAVTVPSGTASGDLVLALLVQNYSGSTSNEALPSGFTQTHAVNTSANGASGQPPPLRLGYRRLTSAPPSSYTFQLDSGTNSDCGLFVFRGVVGSGSPWRVSPTFGTTTGSSGAASSISGTLNDMLVAIFGVNQQNNTGSWTNTASMTLSARSANGVEWSSAMVCHEVLGSTGATGTRTATFSHSDCGWALALGALQAAATEQTFVEAVSANALASNAVATVFAAVDHPVARTTARAIAHIALPLDIEVPDTHTIRPEQLPRRFVVPGGSYAPMVVPRSAHGRVLL